MNAPGFVTTGDSRYRLRYSSWIPPLCTWMASGPTWPAFESVKSSASASSYQLTDLWSKKVTTTSGSIKASVPAHGTVLIRVHA